MSCTVSILKQYRNPTILYNASQHVKKHCNKKKILHKHKCISGTEPNVLYDYVEIYSKYVCIHDVQQCLSGIAIPSLQEQISIVKSFQSIMQDIGSVHDLQGIILKLLIAHDDNALSTLIDSLQQYNNSIDIIKNIVEYTNNTSIPSNETITSI